MNKYLTVKDVMEKLKEFPEDTLVLIETSTSGPESTLEMDFIIDEIRTDCYWKNVWHDGCDGKRVCRREGKDCIVLSVGCK